jgi:hypothetical protein
VNQSGGIWCVAVAGMVAFAGGCSWLEEAFGGGQRHANVPAVSSRETSWRGWDVVEQTNGFVTMRHVPAIGGRTMSLEIGGDDAFLVWPGRAGRVQPAGTQPVGVAFGGHYCCLGPEKRWDVNNQAFNPHSGPYRYRLDRSNDAEHTLTLTSRPGTWKDVTWEAERSITIRRGNTHVTIDERIANRGRQPIDYYLWDFTQIDALDAQGRMRKLTVYLPVPERDGKKLYRQLGPDTEDVLAQFDESVGPGVVAIHYAGAMFKVASDAGDWWLACVDRDSGWTYVKAFEPQRGARYVDNNGPIEVFGSKINRKTPLAFLELELLTGLRRYRPGDVLHQREHWYATICCHGPVVRVNDVGIVAEPLRCRAQADSVAVEGRFGVFYAGFAEVHLFNDAGLPVGRSDPIAINPTRELVLDTQMPTREPPARVMLHVFDYRGRRVGALDSASIQ